MVEKKKKLGIEGKAAIVLAVLLVVFVIIFVPVYFFVIRSVQSSSFSPTTSIPPAEPCTVVLSTSEQWAQVISGLERFRDFASFVVCSFDFGSCVACSANSQSPGDSGFSIFQRPINRFQNNWSENQLVSFGNSTTRVLGLSFARTSKDVIVVKRDSGNPLVNDSRVFVKMGGSFQEISISIPAGIHPKFQAVDNTGQFLLFTALNDLSNVLNVTIFQRTGDGANFSPIQTIDLPGAQFFDTGNPSSPSLSFVYGTQDFLLSSWFTTLSVPGKVLYFGKANGNSWSQMFFFNMGGTLTQSPLFGRAAVGSKNRVLPGESTIVAVSSVQSGEGQVFVFDLDDVRSPTILTRPTASTAMTDFGASLDLNSCVSTLFVGDPASNSSSGSVFVFSRTTGSEFVAANAQNPLTSCIGEACRFGSTISLDTFGTAAAIGAPGVAPGRMFTFSLF